MNLNPSFLKRPWGAVADGLTRLPEESMLEEVKATWMSRLEKADGRTETPLARPVTGIRRWMLQLAGYCYMLGLTRARLHVLWVNGDYRGSGPQYFTYLIEFTAEELDRMWRNMILPNRDSAHPEIYE